jgi:hypothetical protein
MREDGIGLCVKENKQRQKQCKNATAGLRLGGGCGGAADFSTAQTHGETVSCFGRNDGFSFVCLCERDQTTAETNQWQDVESSSLRRSSDGFLFGDRLAL